MAPAARVVCRLCDSVDTRTVIRFISGGHSANIHYRQPIPRGANTHIMMIRPELPVNAKELDSYERAVQAFLRREMDPERFMAVRLQQGVYGQRKDGLHKVRVKLPGARLLPHQLVAIAEVLQTCTEYDVVHVTTRSDIQILHVVLSTRVSGFHNGCAQPEIGDSAITASAGGCKANWCLTTRCTSTARAASGTVSASRARACPLRASTPPLRVGQQALLRGRPHGESLFRWVQRRGREFFDDLLADLSAVTPAPLVEVMWAHDKKDHFFTR